MGNIKNWILTDTNTSRHIDPWQLTSQELGIKGVRPWSIAKKTLRGGLADGVEVIEVNNGELSYTIAITRGMGIWRGHFRGTFLGWRSPVQGPVHPAFVKQDEWGGQGWLAGFDEWIVRCGLNSNGPPGIDSTPDGKKTPLTLHGRIANLPAHFVEVRVNLDPPHEIEVSGRVREGVLFQPNLELHTVIITTPGSNKFSMRDTITNLKSQPSEFQLLYHCNFGPPIAAEGSRILAPIRMVAPSNEHAARGMDHFNVCPPAASGAPESVYFCDLFADPTNTQTLVAVQDPSGMRGCVLRFSKQQMPWFILWKNPQPVSDGYVTGIEPATNLPNFRGFERQNGRVPILPPGGAYTTELVVELPENKEALARVTEDIRKLQGQGAPIVHRRPVPEFSPSAAVR